MQYLACQAAELRRVEEVSGRLPHPRRSAGRLGRRVVVALELLALGRAGLGDRRAESARLDRLRPEVRRRYFAGLERQGHDRSTAVFDEVVKLPYIDASRQGIAGASYGGYAVDWIIGHTNRFKAAVTHDGVFNMESMSLATEELWFTRVGSRRPGDQRRGARELREDVAAPLRREHQDADARHHQRARLPRARRSGPAALHRPAPQRRALEMLVFPDEGHWVLKALNSQRWHERCSPG